MSTQEKIKKLISKSPFHAVFVAQAINSAAKEILNDENKFIKEHRNSIVSPETWIECSNDAKALGLVE